MILDQELEGLETIDINRINKNNQIGNSITITTHKQQFMIFLKYLNQLINILLS